MIIIGLTGGSGAGKGTVGKLLASLGCRVIDTDALYHSMIERDGDCSRDIITFFGEVVRAENGGVDRKALSEIVFGDNSKLAELNGIAHTYVRKACEEIIEEENDKGTSVLVIDAPQLFESGIDAICDRTIAVVSDKNERISRICKRDSISSFKACARIAAQHTDAYFCEKCDYIIENNSDVARLLSKVGRILNKIKERIE